MNVKDRLRELMEDKTPANAASKAAERELHETGKTTYGGKSYTMPGTPIIQESSKPVSPYGQARGALSRGRGSALDRITGLLPTGTEASATGASRPTGGSLLPTGAAERTGYTDLLTERGSAQNQLSGLRQELNMAQRSRGMVGERSTKEIRAELAETEKALAALEEREQDIPQEEKQERWAELAALDRPLTSAERAEARAAIQELRGDPFAGALRTLRGETEDQKDRVNLADALETRVSGRGAAAAGLVAEVPFLGKAAEAGVDKASEIAEEAGIANPYLREGANVYRDAPVEHPGAYQTGRGVMSLAELTLLNGGAEKAAGAVPGFKGLPRAAQNAIRSGLTFGAKGALDEASAGGDPGEIAKAGLIRGAAAAAGSGASDLAGRLGTGLLFKTGLQNAAPAVVLRDGLAGTAFAGADMGAAMALDPEYRPSGGEAAKDLAVAFAFSTLSSLAQTGARTQEAKGRLERDVNAMKQDYTAIVGGADGKVTVSALDDLAARSARVRETLGKTQYVGQQETVSGVYQFLDQLDDVVAGARAKVSGLGESVVAGSAEAGTAPAAMGLLTGKDTAQVQKSAPAEAGAYRAATPRNVELPTVPIINLSMEDVAALNGGELPQSGNYLRKTATERAAARLGLDKNPAVYIEASNVTRNGDSYVLKITKSTLKKMLSASSFKSGVVPLESIAVLENLERIANNGVYFKSEGDRYGRDQVAGYDHLMTTVYIDHSPYLVDMRVRVLQQQEGVPLENTLYHFTPESITVTKQDDGGTSTTGRHAPSIKSEIPPSSGTTIPQPGQGVKSQDAQESGAVSGGRPLPGGTDIHIDERTWEDVGQNKTASTGETGTGLIPLTEQAEANLSTGKNNIVARTFGDIVAFAKNALSKKGGSERLYMGTIPESAAELIRNETGVEVSGYTAILPGSSVQHIFKRHGDVQTESARGQRAVLAEDVALIPRVLASPDTVTLSEDTDAFGRPVLLLSKQIGDTYITAQAVTDGRYMLATNSLWIQKKKNPLDTTSDADITVNPAHDAQSVPPSGPSSDLTIPQTGQGVKSQDAPESGAVSGGRPLPGGTDIHIDERTWEDVGKRKVNAFQYDHPELHGFYAEAARGVLYDLQHSVKGERTPIKDSEGYITRYTGTSRMTSSAVEMALDDAGLSYGQIEKALQNLIADHGQENYAAAKKVELVLDTVLSEGYTDVDGVEHAADEAYLSAKNLLKAGLDSGRSDYRMSEEEWAGLMGEMPVDTEHGRAYDGINHMLPRGEDYFARGEKAEAADVRGVYGADVRGQAEGTDTRGRSPYLELGEEVTGKEVGRRVADWAVGHVVEHPENPAVVRAAKRAAEYAPDIAVVEDAILKARVPGVWALTSNGVVYLSDSMPESLENVIPYHEAVHALKQKGSTEYQTFLADLGGQLDHRSTSIAHILEIILRSRFKGKDLMELSDPELNAAYDELNAIVWGYHKADPENARAQFAGVFTDYDAYIAELDAIMEGARRESGGRPLPGGGYGPNTVGSAESAYRYKQKVSKVRSNTYENSGIFSDVEKQMDGMKPEQMTYDVATEKQSMGRAAERLSTDYAGEAAELPAKEAWTGEDLDTAMGILAREKAQARTTGDYARVKQWAKLIQEHGTRAGQMIQAFAKYTRTPEGILVRAAETLDKAGVDPETRQMTLDTMARFGETLETLRDQRDQEREDVPEGPLPLPTGREALLALIKRQAQARKTPVSKTTEKALRAQDTRYLYDFALTQLENIALDYEQVSAGKRLSTYQAISHLLNLRTGSRNVVSNQLFDVVDAFANDVSLLPDALMSVLTGRRTVGLETSWASEAKRKGALAGAQKGWAEVALDVDMGGDSKYGTGGRRTNHMTGGRLERGISTLEKAMGFELNVTDEFHKGSVEAEVLDSLRRLIAKGYVTEKEARTWAGQEALYRSFQDDTLPGALLSMLKDTMNLVGIGDSGRTVRGRTVHAFGLGDFVQKYTQVPGALMSRAVEFSPVGYGKALWTLARASGSGGVNASAQRSASLSIGRATTGTGLIALFASLAVAGLLGRADDEDDPDIAALNAAEGISGTQLNLDGLGRWIGGGDPTRQTGDTLMSLDFLEPINALMTVGALVAQDDSDKGVAAKAVGASIDGTFQSIVDTPTMQSLSTVFDALRYHKADDETPLWLEIPIELAKSGGTGFIPGPLRQLAQATDSVYRDAYTSSDVGQQAADAVKNALPGLRETLPVKVTPFGEDKTYAGGKGLQIFNTFVMPGALSTYRQSEVSKELQALREETGRTDLYPGRKAPDSLRVAGEKIPLNSDQRDAYQRVRGRTAYQTIESLMDSAMYQGLDAEDQADVIASAVDYADAAAKQDLGLGYEPDQWVMKARGMSEKDRAEFLIMREILGDAGETQAEKRAALADMDGLTEKEKAAFGMSVLGDKSPLDYSDEDALAISLMSGSGREKAERARSAGIPDETFLAAWEAQKDVQGDRGADGKTIALSASRNKKEAIGAAAEDLTAEQRRLLYELFGVSRSVWGALPRNPRRTSGKGALELPTGREGGDARELPRGGE